MDNQEKPAQNDEMREEGKKEGEMSQCSASAEKEKESAQESGQKNEQSCGLGQTEIPQDDGAAEQKPEQTDEQEKSLGATE